MEVKCSEDFEILYDISKLPLELCALVIDKFHPYDCLEGELDIIDYINNTEYVLTKENVVDRVEECYWNSGNEVNDFIKKELETINNKKLLNKISEV